MLDELLQCFDDNGNPTEGRLRLEVKKEPARWWYGGSAIWVVNHRGEILCSRRALHCAGNPGKWQTCFGGHLPVGISFVQNAQKELAEELGVRCEESQIIFLRRVNDEKYKKIEEQFAILLDLDPAQCTFPDGEVIEAQWMTFEEARRQKELYPEQWTNGCAKETEAAIKAEHSNMLIYALAPLVQSFREKIETCWSEESAYEVPEVKNYGTHISGGQCAVTCLVLMDILHKEFLSLHISLASGQLQSMSGEAIIQSHGWLQIESDKDTIIIDPTADQAASITKKIIVSTTRELEAQNLQYIQKELEFNHGELEHPKRFQRYLILKNAWENSFTASR